MCILVITDNYNVCLTICAKFCSHISQKKSKGLMQRLREERLIAEEKCNGMRL